MSEVEMQGKLTVSIPGGHGFGSGADCYVQVFMVKDALLGNKKKCALRTDKDHNAEDPVWDFEKTINLKGTYESILFRVKDAEFFKDQDLGSVSISAEEINGGAVEGEYGCGEGTLRVKLSRRTCGLSLRRRALLNRIASAASGWLWRCGLMLNEH